MEICIGIYGAEPQASSFDKYRMGDALSLFSHRLSAQICHLTLYF
jgi:hypothetical protein